MANWPLETNLGGWSGLEKWESLVHSLSVSRSVVSDSATLWMVAHQAPLSLGFPRQEYWRGSHSFLQRIFLTQGWNLGLLHCRQILYHKRLLKLWDLMKSLWWMKKRKGKKSFLIGKEGGKGWSRQRRLIKTDEIRWKLEVESKVNKWMRKELGVWNIPVLLIFPSLDCQLQ